MAHILEPGDLVKCRHCPEWHPIEQRFPDAGTSYERTMLYITCQEKTYFVGTIGTAARQPAKRPEQV